MDRRFEILYKLDENMYAEHWPVIISCGLLLKDTKTDNIIVQLKFQSVTNKKIIALKIKIKAFDISGNPRIGIDEYQYLDLNVKNGDFFGDNKAIVMLDKVTRVIEIEKIIVVFGNEEKIVLGSNLQPIQKQEKLSKYLEPEFLKQYKRNVSKFSEYVPQSYDKFWVCSCGTTNSTNNCIKCHSSKETVFNYYDPNKLKQNLEFYLQQQKDKINEQKNQEEILIQKKKNKIKIVVGILSALILIISTILIINSIKKQKAYDNMITEIESYISMERYEEAFDMVCNYDITFDDYLEYRETLIPLMKSNFDEIKKSTKENLAFCLNDVEYYVESYEIYSMKNGVKTKLYKSTESYELLDTYYFYSLSCKRALYANGCIYFVEECEEFDSETLDKDYVYYFKSFNLTTGKIETISSERGYANIYCILKLENGSIYVGFDFWDENDGVIYNPYSYSKYEGEDIIEKSRIESAIYGYIW